MTLPRWRGFEAFDRRIVAARESLRANAGHDARLLTARDWLSYLPGYDRTRPYRQMKPSLAALDAELVRTHGERAALSVALGILLSLVESHEARWPADRLDHELKAEFVDSFHRILDAVERGGASSLRMSHDNYAKDFAICLHRLIPAGGQLVDPGCGVPRSLLLRRPWKRQPRQAWYMLVTCGGFRPLAEFHTHERMRHFFTPDGWEYCFRRLPAVFRSYPTLKGVFGASWFFDPQAAAITPTLAFIRDVSERWGGIILRDRVHPAATAGAIEMSGLRRKLYDEGHYRPVNHFMVAAKSRIMAHFRKVPTSR